LLFWFLVCGFSMFGFFHLRLGACMFNSSLASRRPLFLQMSI
jgi:hypothetical protein